MPIDVSAISGTTTAATAASGMFGTAGSPTGAAGNADKEMFLQLLVAQMRYQDPMNPTDSSQFLAQSAQFTALEKMQDVADQTSALFSAQMAFGASGLIGKQVSWIDSDGVTQSGSVSGVTFGSTGPVLDINGNNIPIVDVVTVTQSSTPSSSQA